MRTDLLLATLLCFGLLHCGGGAGAVAGGDGPRGGGTAAGDDCRTSADCPAGSTCLMVAGAGGVCAPSCSVSATDCSGSAECGPVGLLSIDVCREPPPAGPDGEPEPDDAYVPCGSDAECQALDPDALCVTAPDGLRECAARCAGDADCATPTFLGVGVDFFACLEDAADRSRRACLLDPRCEADPLSCTAGILPPPGGPGSLDPPEPPPGF